MNQSIVFFDFFRTLYYPDRTIPEEIIDAVRSLAELHTLVILSSMATESIVEIVAQFGIADYFAEISGGNNQKSERIKRMLEKYKVKSKQTVFISDTYDDMVEGNKAEVQTVGVTWGLHKRENLQRANPFKIIDSPLDLMHAVESALG